MSVCVTLGKPGHMFETGLALREQNIRNNEALVWSITPIHPHKEAHNIILDVYICVAVTVCVPLTKQAHLSEMRLAPREQNIANNKFLVWNISPAHTQ